MNEFTVFDTFSGIGGFAIGFESEGFRTVGFSEVDPEASTVLRHWFPEVRNYGDIRGIGESVRDEVGRVDVVTGGPPCQPASLLGERRGAADERWMWPEYIRLVGLLRPRVAVAENPPAILTLDDGRAFNGIVSAMAEIGFDCLWEVIPAAAVGAGHLRERVFIIFADAQGVGKRVPPNEGDAITEGRNTRRQPSGCGNPEIENGSDADGAGLQGHTGNGQTEGRQKARRPIAAADLRGRVNGEHWWNEINTGIPVLADGISCRLAESFARCAGNAVVPQVAQIVARAVKQYLTQR